MYNNYGQGWGPQNTYAPTTPRNSNVILVTGPDEAVMKTPNDADMLYIDQNKPIMYRVVSDMFGRKSLAEYPYVVPSSDNTAPVTRAEFESLVARISALEPQTEVKENG